jgi:hypothetical protein
MGPSEEARGALPVGTRGRGVALAPFEQMPDASDDLRRRLLTVLPALLYLAALPLLFQLPGPPLWALCGTLIFGLVAIVVGAPMAWRRARGIAMLPELRRALVLSRDEIYAGRPERARARLEEFAAALVDRLGAGRALLLSALANARMHSGQTEHALALLDDLERSGWLQVFSLRRHRATLYAAQALARTQLGDLDGAARFVARIERDSSPQARAARAFLAARLGRPDLAELEALSALGGPNELGIARQARLLAAYAMPEGEPARARHLDALRALGRRPMRGLERGWPELYAFACAADLVGAPPEPGPVTPRP